MPSLAWLHAAHRYSRRATGRRSAWLLPAEEESISPLRILRDELEEPLVARGFSVVTSAMPADLRDSDLALVGAHGSVWFDNGSFRAVSDESQGRMSAAELASRLAGCGVAVLLVCSGGRLDREAFSIRMSGLSYELLHRGCRAVVASPWPLDALTARRWALQFVDWYDAGGSVAEAAYFANEAIRERAPHLCEFLAMHVIGDPLVRAEPGHG